MDGLKSTFLAVKSVMEIPLTLCGFTFSMWQIFLWVMVAGLLIWFLGRVFNDD